MKKLLSFIGSISLISTASLGVVSCTLGPNYDDLFDDDFSDTNSGDYIIEGYARILTAFNNLSSTQLEIQTSLSSLNSNLIEMNAQVRNLREKNMAAILEEIYKLCDFPNSNFSLSIFDDNSFYAPEIRGFNSENRSIGDIEINSGNAMVTLSYLGRNIVTQSFSWSIPEFNLLANIANALNVHDFSNVGDFNAARIDLPIFSLDSMGLPMQITLGSITSLISLLDLTSVTNPGGILGPIISPIAEPLQQILQLDVEALGNVNPRDEEGKKIYDQFDKDFRNGLDNLMAGIARILNQFGMSSEINIGTDEEGEPIMISITSLLDTNIFDLFEFDFDSLNIEQSTSGMDIFINVEIGSHGELETLKIKDLLANIAPNVVVLFNKLLNPDTYNISLGGSRNLLFVVLRELLTDMDPVLLAINDMNNSNNKSAYNARSGLDSLLFNLLIDYNVNRRTDELANLYLKVKLDVSIPIVGRVSIFNDLIDSILNKIYLSPGDIALQIINNLFDLQGESTLDLNTPFLGPDLGMVFLTEQEIDMNAIMEDVDISDFFKSLLVPFHGTIATAICDNLNSEINNAIPEISMMQIINQVPDLMLQELNIEEEWRKRANIQILEADFVFQFYNSEEETWTSITRGISGRTFEIYSSMKVKFTNVQFKIEFTTPENGNFVYYSKDTITFDIIFADTDK